MGCSCSNFDQEEPLPGLKQFVCHDYTECQDSYTGQGIKRTNAWEGTISNNQLRERREEFWRSRKTGLINVWSYIQQAVEADSESAMVMLNMNQIRIESNSLSVCYDFNGSRYEIPAWVINDPVKFSSQDLITEINKLCRSSTCTPSESSLELKLRHASNPQDVLVKLTSSSKVKSLKQLYCTQVINLKISQIRLFFAGKELKDENCISDFSIENGMVIQVFIKKVN